MKRLRIALSGYYGADNLGDEAILEVLLAGLEKVLKEAGQSASLCLLGVPSARRPRLFDLYPPDGGALGTGFVPYDGLWPIFQTIRHCDVFLVGGGGIFQDRTSWASLWFYLFQAFLARWCRKKTIYLAQGLGPLRSWHRWLFRQAAAGSSLITARSESAFDLLRRLGLGRHLYLTADLAWLLPPSALDQEIKRPAVGLVIRKMTALEAENLLRLLRGTFGQLARDDSYNIVFLPFQRSSDLEFSRRLAAELSGTTGLDMTVLDRELTPGQMLSLIGKLDLVVSQRYHGLLLAALARVPAIGLAWDAKVSELARQLGQPCFDPAVLPAGDLISAVREQLGRSPAGQEKMILSAEENFLQFKRVLNLDKVPILGVPISAKNIAEILDLGQSVIKKEEPSLKQGFILSGNPELLVRLTKEPGLRETIDQAALIVPDGVGIVWAARRLGLPLPGRIAGIELAEAFLERAAQNRWRVFLLGGQEAVVRTAADILERRYPGLIVAGVQNGYYQAADEEALTKHIARTRSDLILVGLGMPKQEKWLAANLAKTGIPLGLAVGGSFDIWSGTLKRAPRLVQRLGLEWGWRLAKQPRRWRRMLALLEFYKLIKSSRVL